MKTHFRAITALFVLAAFLPGCMDKTVERITYQANVPVYMGFNEFEPVSARRKQLKSISGKDLFQG